MDTYHHRYRTEEPYRQHHDEPYHDGGYWHDQPYRHSRPTPSPFTTYRRDNVVNGLASNTASPENVLDDDDPAICFVKAYARKPLGAPSENVIPNNSLDYWYDDYDYANELGWYDDEDDEYDDEYDNYGDDWDEDDFSEDEYYDEEEDNMSEEDSSNDEDSSEDDDDSDANEFDF